MKDTNIGLPEIQRHEITIPEEDWPVPQFIPLEDPEREPLAEPDVPVREPALVP